MERELNSLMDRHNAGQKFLRAMDIQSPLFGMAATLIGLIQILMPIDDPSTIGPALATVFMITFYGLILANLLLIPLATKLSHRTESEGKLFWAIRVGAIGIHDLVNPQRIQQNMNALLPPLDQRE
ncbi:MotA/TolQ/ExbB proton channel family protein [Nitrospinaceae bacterium]|nr:MotA/TolQ/ExbB proton channel family protein [Nitrospinaceae bacterium]